MLITITKQDVEKAIEAYALDISRRISSSCPVFQALTRAGVPVGRVGYNTVVEASSSSLPFLPHIARSITCLLPSEWASIETPVTFEYPYVKNTTP